MFASEKKKPSEASPKRKDFKVASQRASTTIHIQICTKLLSWVSPKVSCQYAVNCLWQEREGETRFLFVNYTDRSVTKALRIRQYEVLYTKLNHRVKI